MYINIRRPSIVYKKHKILQKLKWNKNTVITNPEKGNGVVILNRRICIKYDRTYQ